MVQLYKITEGLTTSGFSNPTWIMAASREQAVSKLEDRLQKFFPTYKVEVRAIELVATERELIM